MADARFIEVGDTVLNLAHVVSVRTVGDGTTADALVVHVSTTSGNVHEFHGAEAAALKAFFAPQQTAAPNAGVVTSEVAPEEAPPGE